MFFWRNHGKYKAGKVYWIERNKSNVYYDYDIATFIENFYWR
jgi:hypothetical protein